MWRSKQERAGAGGHGGIGLVLLLGGMLTLGGAGLAAVPAPLRLSSRIKVRSSIITLADLLPANVPGEVRQTAQSITVGASPDPGIERVISRAELRAILSHSPLTPPGLILPDQVIVERDEPQVSRAAVLRVIVQALRQRPGFDASGLKASQLQFPFPIYARPSEMLAVDSIERDPQSGEVRFNLRFAREPQRPPFSVLAPVKVDVPVLVAARTLRAGDLLRPGDVRVAGRGVAPDYTGFRVLCPVQAGQAVRRSMLRPAPLVFAGKPVEMVFQGNGYTLTTTVIATQTAAMGDLVPVRNPATQATATAKVVGPGQVAPVKGAFHELQIFRH